MVASIYARASLLNARDDWRMGVATGRSTTARGEGRMTTQTRYVAKVSLEERDVDEIPWVVLEWESASKGWLVNLLQRTRARGQAVLMRAM